MNWWKVLKAAWTIAQIVKPIKHDEKVNEVIAAVEAEVAKIVVEKVQETK